MEQLDTTRGGCVIGEFVQKLPGEASTLEDGLLHGLTYHLLTLANQSYSVYVHRFIVFYSSLCTQLRSIQLSNKALID